MTALTYNAWRELEDTMFRTVGPAALQRWIEHGTAASQIDNYYELCDAQFISEYGLQEYEEDNGRLPDERRKAIAELLTEIDPVEHADDINQLTNA